MASIRLTQFAGLMPELSAKLKRKDNAQIAHNCLLYDGVLRAMPAFYKYTTLQSPPTSLYRGLMGGFPLLGRVQPDYELVSAVSTAGAPFPDGVYGIMVKPDSTTYVGARYGPVGSNPHVVGAAVSMPSMTSAPTVQLVSPGHLSARPEGVSYAVTLTRSIVNASGVTTIQESVPYCLGGIPGPNPIWYQGDLVQINASLTPITNGENGFRIYRTVVGLESGEQVVNTFDADWHLLTDGKIADLNNPVISFGDKILTQDMLGDLLISKYFQAPYITGYGVKFGLTESGWFWSATDSEVQFSERYLPNAWPISSYLSIPSVDSVVDATCFYDTVYLGTTSRPYRVSAQVSNEDGVGANAYPYPEHQPCLSSTMVTTPFGAMYTSVNGLVALDEGKQQVITRDLLNAGDVLYKQCGAEFKFQDITRAAWFNGWYIGFSSSGKMFVYDAPEDLNDNHPFQQLVTMDAPVKGTPQCYALGDYGLHTAFDKELYYWPVPGWARTPDEVVKLRYQWKSKRFVFPGTTTFSAAKVVWDCDGEVCFRLWGDCEVIYQRAITDCQPFRLPHNCRNIEFEIELLGTGSVSEVHVASSMQDLVEVNTE